MGAEKKQTYSIKGLEFDKPTHKYTYQGEKLVGSISSISAIANGDSFGMASSWASKVVSQEMAALVLDNMGAIVDPYGHTPEEVTGLAEQARNKPNEIRDSSADFGTKLHKYVEEVCNGNDPPLPDTYASFGSKLNDEEKLRKACVALKLFVQKHIQPVASEVRLILKTSTKRFCVPGTADLICQIKNGDPSEYFVLDWKGVTGGSLNRPLKKSFFVQLEAYRHSVIQNFDLNCVGFIICRIDRDSAEIKPEIHRPRDHSLIDAFNACAEIYRLKTPKTELLKGE